MPEDKTKKISSFPSTDWTQLQAICTDEEAYRQVALGEVIGRYWKPLYFYLRRRGFDSESAKDLVQGFLTEGLEKRLFEKGDPSRGRFRSLLLSSLDHYTANCSRAEHTQKRRPIQGLISIGDLAEAEDLQIEASSEAPEEIFHRAWVTQLVARVLQLMKDECIATEKLVHYDIFKRRIIDPALSDTDAPPIKTLAQAHSLSEKEAVNRLITARRAFQRLLIAEIKTYLSPEEVEVESDEILRIIARGR
jgi:hypothetical protein